MPERVSKPLREKVSAAVDATGYTLNQAGRSLRKKSAKTILVALPNIGNMFFPPILDAVEREAARRGYGVLVSNKITGDAPVGQLQNYFLSNRVDGILVFDGGLDLTLLPGPETDELGPPIVVACEEIPGARLGTVVTDNHAAAAAGTRHLIELGHTRIAHLSGPKDNILHVARGAGFSEALSAAGLLRCSSGDFVGDFSLESGADGARALLASTQPPTAVFCDNDEMAIGFISEAHEIGFECPRDISVVGFDDIAVASRIRPPLTTLRQPRSELGRIAAELLLNGIERRVGGQKPQRVVLKSTLIVRKSTAAPTLSGNN